MSSQLGKINVNVDGQMFELEPQEFLHIDYARIKEHLLKYPGDFAWVGAVKEAISKQVAEAEFELDSTYAVLDAKYRSELEGKSREVDRRVKNKIFGDKRYIDTRTFLNDTRYLEGKVKALVSALAKMDGVLIQLSTLYKAENLK